MKTEDKLKKIIEKAIEGGLDCELSVNGNIKIFNGKDIAEKIISFNEFIFSHSFLKCFFGEEPLICSACQIDHDSHSDCDAGFGYDDLKYWQYHAQQLVISEDRIEYLWRFV